MVSHPSKYQTQLIENLFTQYRSLNKQISDIEANKLLTSRLRNQLDNLKSKFRLELLNLRQMEQKLNFLNKIEIQLTSELNSYSNFNTFIKVQLSCVYIELNKLIHTLEKLKIPSVYFQDGSSQQLVISPQGYGNRTTALWMRALQDIVPIDLAIDKDTLDVRIISRNGSLHTFEKTGPSIVTKIESKNVFYCCPLTACLLHKSIIVGAYDYARYSYIMDRINLGLDSKFKGMEYDGGTLYASDVNKLIIYVYDITDCCMKQPNRLYDICRILYLTPNECIKLAIKQNEEQLVAFKIAHNSIYVLFHDSPYVIQKFSMAGEHLQNIVRCEQVTGGYSFCIDSMQNIIFSDYIGDRIRVFNKEGQLLHEIGTAGQLTSPMCVCLNQDERIIIADTFNLQAF